MTRKIFISYNFNDRATAHSIDSFSQENQGYVQGLFVRVTKDVSMFGENAIDQEIRSVMNDCSVALFLIGDNNHNSPWIDREVELALSRNLKIIVARLPNTYGGMPAKLRARGFTPINWSPYDINLALNKN